MKAFTQPTSPLAPNRAEEVLRSVSCREKGRRTMRSRKELAAVFLLSVFVFATGYYSNLFERPFQFIAERSKSLADEAAGTMVVFSFALLIFAYRRWKESNLEVVTQKEVEEALRSLRSDLEQRIQQRTAELAGANEALHHEIAERKRAQATLSQQAGLAALGAEIGVALTRQNELREMLHQCAGSIVRHLDAAFARIWTLNHRENVLELQ